MKQDRTAPQWTGLAAFGVLAVLCIVLVMAVRSLTQDRIATSELASELRVVDAVMPLPHDNDLLNDVIEIVEPAFFGTPGRVAVFRARNRQQVVGLVFLPVVARGYNGPIELAVGIDTQGSIIGVRVTRQAETAGLGDQIDQVNSAWIMGLDGHSLSNTAAPAWAVKSDGGEFDQISGATISPRGVINAVRKVLEFYQLQAGQLIE